MEKFLNVFRIVILTALVSVSLYTGWGGTKRRCSSQYYIYSY